MRSPKAMNIQDCISEKPADIKDKLNEVIMRLEQLSRYYHADVKEVNELVIDLDPNLAVISDSDGKLAVSPNVSSIEVSYLDGVTSSIQDQINAIVPGITKVSEDTSPELGGNLNVSSFAIDGYTSGRAVITNTSGALAVSDITSTELGYLDGSESNIQDQIDAINSSNICPHYTVQGIACTELSGTPVPADWDEAVHSEFLHPSFGSLNFASNDLGYIKSAEQAYKFTMTINSLTAQQLTFNVFWLNCNVYFYVGDTLEDSTTTAVTAGTGPVLFHADLATGDNVLNILICDQDTEGYGTIMLNDFIGTNGITFVS